MDVRVAARFVVYQSGIPLPGMGGVVLRGFWLLVEFPPVLDGMGHSPGTA